MNKEQKWDLVRFALILLALIIMLICEFQYKQLVAMGIFFIILIGDCIADKYVIYLDVACMMICLESAIITL